MVLTATSNLTIPISTGKRGTRTDIIPTYVHRQVALAKQKPFFCIVNPSASTNVEAHISCLNKRSFRQTYQQQLGNDYLGLIVQTIASDEPYAFWNCVNTDQVKVFWQDAKHLYQSEACVSKLQVGDDHPRIRMTCDWLMNYHQLQN